MTRDENEAWRYPADKLGRHSGISGYLPGRVDEARWNQGTGKNNYVASDITRFTFPEPLGIQLEYRTARQ